MSDNHDLSDETFYNPGYKEARKKYMTNPIDNTIDGEVEKILVEMSVDIIDPLASDLEPTQEAIKKIKNLIAQEANKARIDAINQATQPYSYSLPMRSMRSSKTSMKLYATKFFNTKIKERRERMLAQLTADKEQAVLQNKTNDGGGDGGL